MAELLGVSDLTEARPMPLPRSLANLKRQKTVPGDGSGDSGSRFLPTVISSLCNGGPGRRAGPRKCAERERGAGERFDKRTPRQGTRERFDKRTPETEETAERYTSMPETGAGER